MRSSIHTLHGYKILRFSVNQDGETAMIKLRLNYEKIKIKGIYTYSLRPLMGDGEIIAELYTSG